MNARDDDQRDLLIEQATSAWRPRAADGTILTHPAWADLDDAGRVEAFQATRVLRTMEAASDPQGLSATGRAVMERIIGA